MSATERDAGAAATGGVGRGLGFGQLLLLGAAIWLLWQLRSVVGAVLGAAILAAALDPVVRPVASWRIAGRAVGRRAAALTAVLALFSVLSLFVALVAPALVRESREAAQWLPVAASTVREQFDRLEATLGGPGSQGAAILHGESSKLLADLSRTAGNVLFRLTANLLNVLSLLLIPVGAFYFLADGPELRKLFLRHVPRRQRARAEELLGLVQRSLSLYVRGQTAVCLSAAVLYSLLFFVLGLPNALLLGTIAGVAEAVPYLGAVTTSVIVTLAGLTVDPMRALLAVAVYFVVGNSIVNYLLAPRFLSRHLETHPFLVMLASLAGAALGGPVGAVLALPTVVVLQSLVARLAGGSDGASESTSA